MPTATAKVHINIEETGDFNYTYPSLVVNKQAHATIEWSCNHPFVVQFLMQSPLKKVRLRSKYQVNGQYAASAQVNPQAAPGVYYYFVSAAAIGAPTLPMDGSRMEACAVHFMAGCSM